MGIRILIVEDELIIADDLAGLLGRMGHEVVGIAIAGREAIDMAAQSNPDLVLMDVQLQDKMSGAEAACEIQERTGAHIVFVTAFPGALVRKPPRLKEPMVCVGKPFSRAQLETALKSVPQGIRDER
jgi:CheY-like chemotaxis protein